MAFKAFLGRGLSYPLKVGSSGDFQVNIDSDQTVLDSIAFLLHTRLGERVHRPATGSRLPDFKHENNSPALRSLLAQEIRETILLGEPRVGDLTVDVTEMASQPRAAMVSIKFVILPVNTPQNLVFPFYLGS